MEQDNTGKINTEPQLPPVILLHTAHELCISVSELLELIAKGKIPLPENDSTQQHDEDDCPYRYCILHSQL